MKRLQAIRSFLFRLLRTEPFVLALLAVATASVWGFVELADEVFEGDTQAFDRWAVRALRDAGDPSQPIGPPWVQEMGRDATALGGTAWLVLFTGIIAIYLWLHEKTHMMVFMLAAALSGTVVSMTLKNVFGRPRPDLVPHLSHAYSSSFPSGHAMLSAVVYLTVGSLVAAVMPNRKLKLYALGVATLLTVLVGISRVYLGVHYPTDVLAGWLAGLVWALLCWLVARWLQQRGQVEQDPI